jgi:PPOX class probable F420-dependent enzyme
VTKMTDAEIYAFIDQRPARTAKLATVKKDGAPHVAPIWVALDGEDLVFTTHESSLKGRSLRRDPRVAMSFDDDRPPFTFAIVEGTATISEEPEDLLAWATTIGGRYMGDEVAEQYGRRNGVAGELLVRVNPTRLLGQRDIAD